MLHLVQSVEGRVTAEGIEACAEVLELTAAEVAGVATFYTMYKRRPVGDYHVGVCTNTLCAIMGGDAIFDRLQEHLGVGNDETTDDGKITLEHVECNAACDYAPVVMVNWEFMDNMDPSSATQLVDDLREGREVQSTRGPRICTWREAERVLAGFDDGLADEGPAAGPATLVGLQIARLNEWTAPKGAK
jgi:NADH-quinone oxidoreductase subunit E